VVPRTNAGGEVKRDFIFLILGVTYFHAEPKRGFLAQVLSWKALAIAGFNLFIVHDRTSSRLL